ncbi:protein of unknown function [Burkholderia multivorans]
MPVVRRGARVTRADYAVAIGRSGRRAAAGLVNAPRGCGMRGKLAGGAARARDQLAAAVRAAALQHVVRARRAERAFERADPRVAGIGRQILVAAFTTGAQFEHRSLHRGLGAAPAGIACEAAARYCTRIGMA